MALKYYIILQKNDIHSQKSSIWNTSEQIPNENGIYKKQNYVHQASSPVLEDVIHSLAKKKKYPF
jgi:hypothetical protein